MSQWIKVTTVSALQETGKQLVKVQDEEILLIWWDSKPWAVFNLCTHDRFPLDRIGQLENGKLRCGVHFALFDVTNGQVLEGPEDSDPDTIPCLPRFHTRIDGADIFLEWPAATQVPGEQDCSL
jgi:3-phenylpropionate/trans-cinnamate dioxygenase ferredoxin component